MKAFSVPYGREQLRFWVPDKWRVTELSPPCVPTVRDLSAAVAKALDSPVGDVALTDFGQAQSAAIAVCDKTRPVPYRQILPPLLTRLESLGLGPDSVTLLIATGTHDPVPPTDFAEILPPDVVDRYPVVCHDAADKQSLAFLGTTSRGTPVWVNRTFIDADLRIATGNIQPHQFMGYSGGVKTAAIGLAGWETANANHAMMRRSKATLGQVRQNPAREDVEEIRELMGVVFALNVIPDVEGNVTAVLSGEAGAVIRKGVELARPVFEVEVRELFDVVIASAGGYPKDLNLYQSQKALSSAGLVTRDGGVIILVAACTEGVGSESYQQWVAGMDSHEAVLQRLEREGFMLGPHKAFQIAKEATRVQVRLVSELDAGLVQRLLLEPVDSIQQALSWPQARLGMQPCLGVMPQANVTVPTGSLSHDSLFG